MAKRGRADEADLTVTENEGAVLSLIARTQPVTRHRLTRAFRDSPTTSYNTSKGTVYPLISRMVDRGLVKPAEPHQPKAGEALSLTERGYQALNRWLNDGPVNSFGHDPLLDRIMSLGGVSRDEQVRWIAGAKALLLTKKDELKAYRESVDAPFIDVAHGSAMAVLDAKLEWLDRLLIAVVSGPES